MPLGGLAAVQKQKQLPMVSLEPIIIISCGVLQIPHDWPMEFLAAAADGFTCAC
jgi:hypothetical protein